MPSYALTVETLRGQGADGWPPDLIAQIWVMPPARVGTIDKNRPRADYVTIRA